MKNFNELGLPQPMLHALEKMKFSTPTPIQAQAIPLALAGRDILGSAQTGTGKTAAFGIPLLAHLIKNPQSTAVVLTPTRELAVQVMKAIHEMQDRAMSIPTALLIGGEAMPKQFHQLQRKPRIVVGTPGRINDHLTRRSLKLNNADFLVLDETDRMLDMGFGIQVEKIVENMPKSRQTLMFSATMPPYIVKMSEKYMNQPERIAVGSTTQPMANIKQEEVRTTVAGKYESLTKELYEREGSVIVFVKTKRGADRMTRRLNGDDLNSEALHGDLKQSKRDRVIQAFRNKKFRVLVATDVAARGLDIPHIEHVINFDLPQVPEDYIHRIGRTARAGAEGSAVCFITPEDRVKWNAILKLIDPAKAAAQKTQEPRASRGKKPYKAGKPKSFRFKSHSRKEGGRKSKSARAA
jgi:superfamily II DNA/RNA helicase